jgi:hypothetical protein
MRASRDRTSSPVVMISLLADDKEADEAPEDISIHESAEM